MALTAGAGPASNILLALICIPALAITIRFVVSDFHEMYPYGDLSNIREYLFLGAVGLTRDMSSVEQFSEITKFSIGQVFLLTLLGRMVIINIGLAIFNLLPFGPLDGASIMRGFLPSNLVQDFDKIQPFLTILILVLFFTGYIGVILGPLFSVAINYLIVPWSRLFL